MKKCSSNLAAPVPKLQTLHYSAALHSEEFGTVRAPIPPKSVKSEIETYNLNPMLQNRRGCFSLRLGEPPLNLSCPQKQTLSICPVVLQLCMQRSDFFRDP